MNIDFTGSFVPAPHVEKKEVGKSSRQKHIFRVCGAVYSRRKEMYDDNKRLLCRVRRGGGR